MREGDCNIERLTNTILGKPADRVPNLEVLVDNRSVDALVGMPLIFPWPAKTYRTYMLPPYDYVALCQKVSMDAIMLLHYWSAVQRTDEELAAEAAAQNPTVHDWSDLDKMGSWLDIGEMIRRLRGYKRAAEGKGIGVTVGTRSVLCNTYETLGIQNCMIKMCEDLDLVRAVMDKYMDYAVAQTEALLDEGVDFFFIDDDVSMTTGFICPPWFMESEWFPRTDRILEPVRKKGLPILMHCCGNLRDVIPYALRLGVHALHPFQPGANDIYALKKQYDGQLTFMGNMDIAGVLSFGTPDEVRADTREHIERLAGDGRYICCSSHSIIDSVPPENFLAMVDACHIYGTH
jgi:hypothetical protein